MQLDAFQLPYCFPVTQPTAVTPFDAWLLRLAQRGSTLESRLPLPVYLRFFSSPELEWLQVVEALQLIWTALITLTLCLIPYIASSANGLLPSNDLFTIVAGTLSLAWLAVCSMHIFTWTSVAVCDKICSRTALRCGGL